jgi:hypothetical protein
MYTKTSLYFRKLIVSENNAPTNEYCFLNCCKKTKFIFEAVYLKQILFILIAISFMTVGLSACDWSGSGEGSGSSHFSGHIIK